MSSTSTTTTAALDPSAHLEPAEGDASSREPQLLVFHAAGRRYAAPLEAVREILVARPLTRLPGAPPAVLGLLNVRGTIVTVIDLGARLKAGGAATAPGPATEGGGGGGAGGHILIVEADGGQRRGGLRVDLVQTVGRVQALAPPPPAGNADTGTVVMAIGELDGQPLPVLDLPAIVRQTLLFSGER